METPNNRQHDCSPTLTECPRCKNRTLLCDRGTAEPLPEGWKKLVVSAIKVPPRGHDEKFKQFVDILLADNNPGVMEIKGLVIVDGPGCANYGILITGSDIENWANQFTMGVVGKWSYAHDDDEMVWEGRFEDLRSTNQTMDDMYR